MHSRCIRLRGMTMLKIKAKTKSGCYRLDNGNRVVFDGSRWVDRKAEYGEFFRYEPVYNNNDRLIGFKPVERCYTRVRHFIQSKAGELMMLGALAILFVSSYRAYCGIIPVDEMLINYSISLVLGLIGFALANDADKRGE